MQVIPFSSYLAFLCLFRFKVVPKQGHQQGRLFIGNVHQDVTVQDLTELFCHYGILTKVSPIGQRGYAFVHLESIVDAHIVFLPIFSL